MKRGKKNSDLVDSVTNSDARTGSSELDAMKPYLSSMKSMGLLLAVLMTASVMFSLSVVLRDPPSDDVVETGSISRTLHSRLNQEFPLKSQFHEDSRLHRSGNSMFAYRHLDGGSIDQQKLFFCEENQVLLEETPWLIMKAERFFVPSLFSISSFKQELEKLFPEKETGFYFLGQYLFHPTNVVWGLVTRYYHAYLARADQRIGIHIRDSNRGNGQFPHLVDQILDCGARHKLLPEVNKQRHLPSSQVLNRKYKAVFIASSSPEYFENIRDRYWENPTVTGEIISVHEPSHKEYQKTKRNMESKRALADIYLLSYSDVLVVTRSRSSLVDVAQGLGGLKPWVLNKAEKGTANEPYCVRAKSMEPFSQTSWFNGC